jgi:hypothetical protein
LMPYRLTITWEVATAPRAQIALFGGPVAERAYESFTAPHPRFKAVGRKQWGVALLPLPTSFEEYLGGPSRELVRRKRKRAHSKGFSFGEFHAPERVKEILEINLSAPVRQGQAMEPNYLSEQAVQRFAKSAERLYGVFDAEGRLRAYAYAPLLGDVGSFHRLLGHAKVLQEGIMYLLISDVIATYIERKCEVGHPAWAMYDSFWGAREGLAHHKKRLGFRPYRVDWVRAGDA